LNEIISGLTQVLLSGYVYQVNEYNWSANFFRHPKTKHPLHLSAPIV